MKKTLSFILSLVMVLSCAVTLLTNVSAETVAEAPAGIRHQHTEVANDTQDIRFIAGVKNLKGSCLGYKIEAEYTHESEYRRTLYEGSTSVVFESIVADNETLDSDKLYGADTEYQYLFTMKITGVPTNIGAIYFRIWTYVQVGEEKIWSEESNAQYVNGTKDTSLISYNFENVSAFADLKWKTPMIANSGISSIYPPKDPSIVSSDDGNKYLSLQGGGTIYEIVADGGLSEFDKYTVEMDVKITSAGKFGLILNNSGTVEDANNDKVMDLADNKYIDFSIRGFNTTSNGVSTPEKATENDKMVIRIQDQWFCPPGTRVNTHPYNFGEDLHFTIIVDNAKKTTAIYVNGTLLKSLTSAYTTKNGGVYMSNQNAPMTIDNIRVYGK